MNEETVKVKPPYIFNATVYCEACKDQLRKLAEEFVNDGYTVEMDEETPKLNSYNNTIGEQGARYLKVKIYDARPPRISVGSLTPPFSPLIGAQEVAGDI